MGHAPQCDAKNSFDGHLQGSFPAGERSAALPFVTSLPYDMGVSSPSPVTINVLRTQRHVGNRLGDDDVC